MRNRQLAEDARALVRTAQERARTLGHPEIGSEHLLFAVADAPTRVGEVARDYGLTPDGVATQTDRLLARPRRAFDNLDAEALAAIGIDLDAVREALETNFGPIPPPWPRTRPPRLPGHLPITGRARSCLRAAATEARRRGVSPARGQSPRCCRGRHVWRDGAADPDRPRHFSAGTSDGASRPHVVTS
ncbi:Clp protease N-terminal domain-containing protein [Amycolatopsis sp. NPDC051372]